MCMHRQLLDDFFDKVICDSIPHVELAKIFDEEVAKVIEPYSSKINEKELEELKEIIYSTTYTAEKHGFYLGIYTLTRILFETLYLNSI